MLSRRWLLTLGAVLLCATPTPADPPQKVRQLTHKELTGFIDAKINERLQKESVKAAPLADEAEFLRRVSLDLTGRIPRVSEVRDFLKNTQPDNRAALVERLLESPHYVTHMTDTWQALMLPQAAVNVQFQFFATNFRTWLTGHIRANTPYDRMVRELLTTPANQFGRGQPVPGGGNQFTGAQAFYQANENKAENLASSVGRIFLGVRIECAQCHDHPFSSWSRHQFWETAAFFASIDRSQQQRFVRPGQQPAPQKLKDHEIKIGGTEKVVSAKFLDGKQPNWEIGGDVRAAFAEWVVTPENKYFAQTAANRIWAHFMGYGLNDPIDDEPTNDNPITHPELLQELTRQFVAHNHDVRYLIRAITSSRTYQTSSVLTEAKQKDPRLFARMTVRGLTAEQLYESLAQATGYREGNLGAGRFGFNNPGSMKGDILTRFSSQERRVEAQTSILQALALMNGRLVGDATNLERSKTLGAVADAPFLSVEEKLETLFLATVTRRPRAEELARLSAYVNNGGARGDSRAALTDVFWALLNSPEFFLNR